MGMRNWEQEQVVKKHLLGCYVDPELKQRIKVLARARRISISQLARELIEFALPRLEAQSDYDLNARP
jgi:predicted transcriptional regulator